MPTGFYLLLRLVSRCTCGRRDDRIGAMANSELRRSMLGAVVTYIGLVLLWLGYFLPWVPHRAAALSMGAYDLSDWVTRLPQVQAGSLPVGRMHFLALLALAVALTAGHVSWGGIRRWLLLPAGLGALMLLPAYPSIMWYRTEAAVQAQLGLLAATLLVAAAFLHWRHWRWIGLVQGVAAALLGTRALGGFLLVRPVVGELYGALPPIGPGWYATLTACALIFLDGVLGVALRLLDRR